MRDWFESLQPRERLFVATAAVVVVLAVFWLGVWAPLDRGRENGTESIRNWQAAVTELRSLQGALRAGAGDPRVPESIDSLVVIVDETLRSRNLYSALQRSTPNQNRSIQLVFENAAFDDLVLWLGDVSERYGLRVQQAGFNHSDDAAGRVNATVTLER